MHIPVIIVGAGQAGLSLSHYLKQSGIEHRIFEKRTMVHAWKHQRWDSFTLVTPNWQCLLPDHPYDGPEPYGFMPRTEIVAYLERFIEKLDPPVVEGVAVQKVRPTDAGFTVETSQGSWTASQVIVAAGDYQRPVVPRFAERLPADVAQIQSSEYRNARALPEGAVLVAGSGQSGTQIAEDLHLEGRQVFLATGDAPRCSRVYRGKDVVEWLSLMGYYDIPVEEHPLREGVRYNTNHYVTGRDGGRDIDLRRFAREGMELFGSLMDFSDGRFHFQPNLCAHLDNADAVLNRINRSIDDYIERERLEAPPGGVYEPVWSPAAERTELDLAEAGIRSVVWCIGFTPDFSWVDAPVFNGRGEPSHTRGVTPVQGLYFLGLPWLHTWGSGRFSGVARDAAYLAERIRRTQEAMVVRKGAAASARIAEATVS